MQQNQGLLDMIEKIHYNPQVPENCNVRHKNKKNKEVEVFRHDRWITCNRNSILNDMIKHAAKLLGLYFSAEFMTDRDLHERMETIHKFQNQILEGARGGYPPNFYYTLRNSVLDLIVDTTRAIRATETQDTEGNATLVPVPLPEQPQVDCA